MSDCCNGDAATQFAGESQAYKRVIWLVIAINAGMFVVEVTAGALAQSQALQADALDFLGDAVTYAISLAVIGRTLALRASAALFKGLLLALVGLWVLGSTLYRVFVLPMPDEVVMGSVGLMAFVANLTAAVLLMRWRNGDANVRSVWLCSRNDTIGNVAVILAAIAVGWTASAWPDLVVAAAMAALFMHSAVKVIRQARKELAFAHAPRLAEKAATPQIPA